ncbi:uncharacterized protein HD556DRAFT_1449510 [Suillus plorans]|uniref:Uncharacterized protein n=1 Tax=Suillus plorans TaxID=116603 RepID=A0A9P7AEK7_9AGAM|nr:uncharacterized protein HD556DRAFT_1449510 [Suillus plorans]KAG1786709.1 hypothetical protein HD556DRAFT_1449510 [Suillus plorans]
MSQGWPEHDGDLSMLAETDLNRSVDSGFVNITMGSPASIPTPSTRRTWMSTHDQINSTLQTLRDGRISILDFLVKILDPSNASYNSDLASLFALGVENSEVLPRSTRNRKSSSSSIDDTLYALRSVRRLLDTSETVCPVSGKTVPSQHAANNPTASPTKTSSRKSSRCGNSHISSISFRIIQLRFRQSWKPRDAPRKYPLPLENISMKVSCDKRHATTWDEPDHAFLIFPAQLLIACTSTHDFDPLLVPAVTLVHLNCSTVAKNGAYKSHSQISLKTFYDGATIHYVNDKPTPDLS